MRAIRAMVLLVGVVGCGSAAPAPSPVISNATPDAATVAVVDAPAEPEPRLDAGHQVVMPSITPELVAQGSAVFDKLGCRTCHTTDGTAKIGASIKGLYGSTVVLNDGRRVTADATYVWRAIMTPSAEVVAAYPAIMPSFEGVISDAEMFAIIAYIESLAAPPP